MDSKKLLVFFTLALSLLLFGVATTHELLKKPAPLVVARKGSLTLGKATAPIEIVLIEDLQCKKCRAFSLKVLPKIQKHYIETGKARLTIVPVSFLAGSQALGNAALEVYAQKPEKLIPYLKEALTLQGEAKIKDLIKMAHRVGEIDLTQLTDCIDQGCHNETLDQNLNWAREWMGLQFRTPALYINGAPGSVFSFEAIQYQIEQMEKKP